MTEASKEKHQGGTGSTRLSLPKDAFTITRLPQDKTTFEHRLNRSIRSAHGGSDLVSSPSVPVPSPVSECLGLVLITLIVQLPA